MPAICGFDAGSARPMAPPPAIAGPGGRPTNCAPVVVASEKMRSSPHPASASRGTEASVLLRLVTDTPFASATTNSPLSRAFTAAAGIVDSTMVDASSGVVDSTRHGIEMTTFRAVCATSGAVTDAEVPVCCGHVIDAVEVLTGRNGVRMPATTAMSPATAATSATVRDCGAPDARWAAAPTVVSALPADTSGDFGTGAS